MPAIEILAYLDAVLDNKVWGGGMFAHAGMLHLLIGAAKTSHTLGIP
jgi:hypothetical protein